MRTNGPTPTDKNFPLLILLPLKFTGFKTRLKNCLLSDLTKLYLIVVEVDLVIIFVTPKYMSLSIGKSCDLVLLAD